MKSFKKTIARYQGQVTLGKILTVVFHEGRKPLNALKQHPAFISAWSKEFIGIVKKHNLLQDDDLIKLYEKILDRLQDNKAQAELFIGIFKKIEPLANAKRASAKEFLIVKPIKDSFKLFEGIFIDKEITYIINGDVEASHIGWEIDIQIVFANLIENSIYWMSESTPKNIIVSIEDRDYKIIIDDQDTGMGIDEENIQNQQIFLSWIGH